MLLTFFLIKTAEEMKPVLINGTGLNLCMEIMLHLTFLSYTIKTNLLS